MNYLLIIDQFKKAKADVSSINSSMTNDSLKIDEMKNILYDFNEKINKVENEKVKVKALSIQNKFSNIINNYSEKIKDNMGTYNNIQAITPQAGSAIFNYKNTNGGLAFNTGAVMALTAATGAVYAAVSGLSDLLDPVHIIMNKQAELLDMYIKREINESEYEQRALALENELETKTFFIQKKTGINVPAALIIAGVIYGTYKVLQGRGVISKIKAAIK